MLKVESTFELPRLGSNHDSPDLESAPLGQRSRSSWPGIGHFPSIAVTSLPQNARFCPEKL